MEHPGRGAALLLVLCTFLGPALRPAAAQTWAFSYGGIDDDAGGPPSWVEPAVRATSDGGFLVATHTWSFGATGIDLWVVKLSSAGEVEWETRYDTGDHEWPSDLIELRDGSGYIIAGQTDLGDANDYEAWVLALDRSGTVLWDRTFGGLFRDLAMSVVQTIDGGFLVAGWESSFGQLYDDIWLLKLDPNGNLTWQRSYGTEEDQNEDQVYVVRKAPDGGFILAGTIYWDVPGFQDGFLLKLDPSGNVAWMNGYGELWEDERLYDVTPTPDGGYLVLGEIYLRGSGSDEFWVLKVDAGGAVQWQSALGTEDRDFPEALEATSDGGYLLAGTTRRFQSETDPDALILKLDAAGQYQWATAVGGPGGRVPSRHRGSRRWGDRPGGTHELVRRRADRPVGNAAERRGSNGSTLRHGHLACDHGTEHLSAGDSDQSPGGSPGTA